MAPRLAERATDACLAFCGKCRHLQLSLNGPHSCAKGHDLADSGDYLRCLDRSAWPDTGMDSTDMSE